MKKSFELEEGFRSLNHIPRSQVQKRKTFENIMNSRPEKQYSRIFGNLAGIFLAISLFSSFSSLLYIQITAPADEGHSDMAIFGNGTGKAVKTYFTKSYSNEYFSLHSNLKRKGIFIKENEAWLETIDSALAGMVPVHSTPSGYAGYDLLVILDGRDAIKCKIWLTEKEVYLKKLKEDNYYKIEGKDAESIIKIMEYVQQKGFRTEAFL
ncbi:hypothetical protein [Bacillus sp. REN3]|uniref:hypothetical protein n=1 Tax=Bacillus sp. REN3 TaxID=2802440 RepID=UPI001AEF1D47|nr:hypothetical protein [Bacillus sp. REN3]